MPDPGRPSDLTPELTTQIRKLVLESVTYEEIKQILDIPDGTWDAWVYKDYKDFRSHLHSWKKERIIRKAESVLESALSWEDDKLKLNAAQFSLETLGKLDYSKKVENDITSGGKPIPILGNAIQPNNSPSEDSKPK